MDGEDAVRSHLAKRLRGNRVGEHAIDELASLEVNREEHAGIGATGAHWIDEIAGAEDHAFTADEIGGGNREWNAQLFKRATLEESAKKSAHAVVGSEAVARKSPAGEIFKTYEAREFF